MKTADDVQRYVEEKLSVKVRVELNGDQLLIESSDADIAVGGVVTANRTIKNIADVEISRFGQLLQ